MPRAQYDQRKCNRCSKWYTPTAATQKNCPACMPIARKERMNKARLLGRMSEEDYALKLERNRERYAAKRGAYQTEKPYQVIKGPTIISDLVEIGSVFNRQEVLCGIEDGWLPPGSTFYHAVSKATYHVSLHGHLVKEV